MNNNKQQTTVDWIEQEMLKGNLSLKEILIQAKQKEKERIINAYEDGNYDNGMGRCEPEQYYNETYGEK
jgi:hypothetical protein